MCTDMIKGCVNKGNYTFFFLSAEFGSKAGTGDEQDIFSFIVPCSMLITARAP